MTDLQCRLISSEDSKEVLDWRNDPVTREMSMTTSVISWSDHSDWFSKMLDSSTRIGFIGELGGEKIGVVFMHVNKSTAKVSINLNPAHRGKKLAGRFLRKVMIEVQKLNPKIDQFIAEIKNANTLSAKIFVQNGFVLTVVGDGFSVYNYNQKGAGV